MIIFKLFLSLAIFLGTMLGLALGEMSYRPKGVSGEQWAGILSNNIIQLNSLCPEGDSPTNCTCTYGTVTSVQGPFDIENLSLCRPDQCQCPEGSVVHVPTTVLGFPMEKMEFNEVKQPIVEIEEYIDALYQLCGDKVSIYGCTCAEGSQGESISPQFWEDQVRSCMPLVACKCWGQTEQVSPPDLRLAPALVYPSDEDLLGPYMETVQALCPELESCSCEGSGVYEIVPPLSPGKVVNCASLVNCQCTNGELFQAPELDLKQLRQQGAIDLLVKNNDSDVSGHFMKDYLNYLYTSCPGETAPNGCDCKVKGDGRLFWPFSIINLWRCPEPQTCTCPDGSTFQPKKPHAVSFEVTKQRGSIGQGKPSSQNTDLFLDLYRHRLAKSCHGDTAPKTCQCKSGKMELQVFSATNSDYVQCQPSSCTCSTGVTIIPYQLDLETLELVRTKYMSHRLSPIRLMLLNDNLRKLRTMCPGAKSPSSCKCSSFRQGENTVMEPFTIETMLRLVSSLNTSLSDNDQ